jgi:long-chain acyl-CoA synthetase
VEKKKQSIAERITKNDGRVVELADVRALPELLRWRVRETPEAEAYRHFDPNAGRWVSHSWQAIDGEFDRWRRALTAEGFGAGERIAILAASGIEHIAMDQAALSRGLVPVPMHALDNPESIVYILQDSGASLLFVDSGQRWQALAAAAGKPIENLKRIVCASQEGAPGLEAADGRIVALDRWLESASAVDTTKDIEVQPNDLAAIVYTSGTTGRPKGVMLSHENIVANVKAIHRRLATRENDIFLSFLPLSRGRQRSSFGRPPLGWNQSQDWR